MQTAMRLLRRSRSQEQALALTLAERARGNLR